MTIQDFIVIYNQTFIYLHDKYGKSAVVDLWKTLSRQYCIHLAEMTKQFGLNGYYEFFYGQAGTARREHVDGKARFNDHEGFYEHIDHCPSIQTLVDRNKKIYRYYCEHCYWLYAASLENNGFHYDGEYWLQETDKIINYCTFRANK